MAPSFGVRLLQVGNDQYRVISKIQSLLKVSPSDALDLVRSGHVDLAIDGSYSSSFELVNLLRSLGAEADLFVTSTGHEHELDTAEQIVATLLSTNGSVLCHVRMMHERYDIISPAKPSRRLGELIGCRVFSSSGQFVGMCFQSRILLMDGTFCGTVSEACVFDRFRNTVGRYTGDAPIEHIGAAAYLSILSYGSSEVLFPP